MSVDCSPSGLVARITHRLPSRATVRAGLLTVWYLAVLTVGVTLLVTLDLVVRLSALP